MSGHRLIALLEIISPGNKDRGDHVAEFIGKATAALELGIHLLLVDLFPPGSADPQGMHGALWASFSDEPYDVPPNEPLTLASYVAEPQPDAYLEHLGFGRSLPDMPLFLRPDRYVNAPLETTYQAAFRGVPEFWRNRLMPERPA